MIVPSAEQIATIRHFRDLVLNRGFANTTITERKLAHDMAYLLDRLDTLSQEVERLKQENTELLTRSGKPDGDRDFSIHASTDGGS